MSLPRIGEVFQVRHSPKHVNTFRRDPDDPSPVFECERMRVTLLEDSRLGAMTRQQSFPAEMEWFRQRGIVAADSLAESDPQPSLFSGSR